MTPARIRVVFQPEDPDDGTTAYSGVVVVMSEAQMRANPNGWWVTLRRRYEQETKPQRST